MSTTITEFVPYKFKQEVLNKFRWGFNSSDTQARVTENTTTFDGDNSTTKFLLSASSMSYVKSVSVGGTPLEFGSAWDIIWRGADKGKVEFTTAPASGTDNISIVWGEVTGSSNYVYSDFPRSDLGATSYPRVGFKLTVRRKPGGLGGGEAVIRNDVLIQIKVVDIDVFNIDYIVSEIDNFIISNAKNFYYFDYIEPESIEDFNNYDDNTEETNYRVVSYIVKDKLQVVTFV